MFLISNDVADVHSFGAELLKELTAVGVCSNASDKRNPGAQASRGHRLICSLAAR
jgi:hypothetical protein